MYLVTYAHNLTQSLPEVAFAFSDIFCSLKIKIKERYKNTFMHSYNPKDELHKKLNSISCDVLSGESNITEERSK